MCTGDFYIALPFSSGCTDSNKVIGQNPLNNGQIEASKVVSCKAGYFKKSDTSCVICSNTSTFTNIKEC